MKLKAFLFGMLLCAVPLLGTELMLSGPVLNVSGATSATPIEITTSAAHNAVTGDVFSIRGVVGNDCANGDWQVTVTAATTFTLDNSVGAACGTYAGTTGDVATMRGIRATGTSSWFDVANADDVYIHVFGSSNTTSTVVIETAENARTALNVPVPIAPFTAATITDATTAGETYTGGAVRVRVRVSAWAAGTVYATIDARRGATRIY